MIKYSEDTKFVRGNSFSYGKMFSSGTGKGDGASQIAA